MFRNILSSRPIIAGIVFFLLVVVSSLLHHWHIRRTTDAKLARPDPVIQHLENRNEARTAADTVDISGVDFEQSETPLETDDAQATEIDDTAALPGGTAASVDLADAFLPNDIVEEGTTEVPVSPFGFGPYPELPEGWSPNIWPSSSPKHELMMRVRIRLTIQGVNVLGAIMDNGLVYPTIKNTVYVEWDEEAGQRYISHLSGDPEACKRLNAIEEATKKEGGFSETDIPSDIKIVPFEEGGIDPYQFLELP